ncbi:MAG: alanine racemase [Desulfobacter sp.]|nr:alanine racemase [Desulfobacter sp.]WDP84722.1 MAG: alanine racemase [Desulfobacter sp.]
MDWTRCYGRYRKIFSGQRFPLAFVDLDQFDRNVAYVAATQKNTGKTIRVASKSIRSLDLIKRVFEKGGPAYQGILSFTMEEAGFLFDNGLDDIIVAYPTAQPSDLALFAQKTRQGANLALMADSFDHLKLISRAGETAGIPLKVCLDVDMSFRALGARVHLGVRRSPVYSPDQVLDLAVRAGQLPCIRVAGIMGYEAQIASLNDNMPSQAIKNKLLRLFKQRSVKELTRRREQMVARLKQMDIPLEVVNGGGSGSLLSTGKDRAVTEVTAGSAFFAPGLFTHFHEVHFEPAAFFALQVARIPKKGMVTCQGGGYVGSGEVNVNRLPWPVMPPGLSYIPMEGAGEVQTPLILPSQGPDLKLGDPVFFQHAKAGELCERFNELHLVKDNRLAGRVSTYRGKGLAFL